MLFGNFKMEFSENIISLNKKTTFKYNKNVTFSVTYQLAVYKLYIFNNFS